MVEFGDPVVGDPGEGVSEPGSEVDAVQLRGLDQGVGDRGGMSTYSGAHEELAFTAERRPPFILPMSGSMLLSTTAGTLFSVGASVSNG